MILVCTFILCLLINTSDENIFANDFNPTSHMNWKLVNNENCGMSNENRIIGGKNASLGQYPWIARIAYSDEIKDGCTVFKCGGSLITQSHVVTAAHCVMNLPVSLELAFVRLGEYNEDTNIDCVGQVCAPPHEDYNIDHAIFHHHYGKPKNLNDIGLLKLDKAVRFTQWIAPICLPFGSLLQKTLTGSIVDIAGWGYYDISVKHGSAILQTLKIPVVDTSTCIKKFRRFFIDANKQLCVGGTVGKDSCMGDSGGPLMKVEVEGRGGPKHYLFGIVSFGASQCGMSNFPAVYTNIVYYMKWILDALIV